MKVSSREREAVIDAEAEADTKTDRVSQAVEQDDSGREPLTVSGDHVHNIITTNSTAAEAAAAAV